MPHPDDLEVKARTGEVYFNGPFDDGEKVIWDRGLQRKKDAGEEIAWMSEEAEKEPDRRQSYDESIASERQFIDLPSLAFPDEKARRVPEFNIHEWREKEKARRERRAEWRKLRQGWVAGPACPPARCRRGRLCVP